MLFEEMGFQIKQDNAERLDCSVPTEKSFNLLENENQVLNEILYISSKFFWKNVFQ